MPIPFRDAEEVDELGAAGFLRFIRDREGTALAGGVLLVDARAEPLELVHHWMALPGGALWSNEEAWRHGGRRLAADLFRALGRTPAFLLVLDTPSAELWLRDLEIGIPVGITAGMRDGGVARVRWVNGDPPSPSRTASLYERLAGRGLLMEPFDRIARALQQLHPTLVRETGDSPP